MRVLPEALARRPCAPDARRADVGVPGGRLVGRGVSLIGDVMELWLPRRALDVDTFCSEPASR